MHKKSTSFVLILLLALLQCVAPLLHAHAMGAQAGSGVHVPDDFKWNGKTGHPTGLEEIGSVSPTDAPAISVAKERKQDAAIALADPAGTECGRIVGLSRPASRLQFTAPPFAFHRSLHFFFPLPQAPPAAA